MNRWRDGWARHWPPIEDSEMALEGYALLKVLGKGSGLDALRRDMSVRFTRKARATENPAAVA